MVHKITPMNGDHLAWRYAGNADPFIDHQREVAEGLDSWVLSVVENGHHTCASCGFESQGSGDEPCGHMQAMPCNMNYDDRDIEQWVCVCPFCHAQRNAILFAMSGQFKFVCMSDLTQAEINSFIIPLLYFASDVEQKWFMEANEIYDDFEKSAHNFVSMFPHIPNVHKDIHVNITTYMKVIDAVMSPHQYRARDLVFDSVRLIPSRNAFQERALYWGADRYSGLSCVTARGGE